MVTNCFVASCLLAIGLLARSASAQGFSHRVIAVKDQIADPRDGTRFLKFEPPSISPTGDVAFCATLQEPDTGAARFGLWRTRNGELSLVARGNDPVDMALTGGTWLYFESPNFTSDGGIGFVGQRYESGYIEGFYWVSADSASWIGYFDDGPFSPPAGSWLEHGSHPIALSDNGISAILGGVNGTSSDDAGIWAGPAGGLTAIARTHVPLPGAVSSLTPVRLGRPQVNNLGQAIFFAGNNEDIVVGGGSYDDEGLWYYGGHLPQELLRTGMQATGFANGTRVSGFRPGLIGMNNSGQFAVWGVFRNRPAPFRSEGGAIWLGTLGSLSPIAARGDAPPGLPAEVTFGSFNTYPPLLNAVGDVVLHVELESSNTQYSTRNSLWKRRNGSSVWQRILIEDQASAALPPDHVFRHSPTYVINGNGDIAFSSPYGLYTSNAIKEGLFWYDEEGGVQPVILDGELIEVSPGVTKTLRNVSITGPAGGEDGRPTSLSEEGQIAYMAGFTDGTFAIMVSERIPPPCPGDVNGDRTVDVQDFLDFLDSFGQCLFTPGPCVPPGSVVDSDFNGDTVVDVGDLLEFFDTFGQAQGACPE